MRALSPGFAAALQSGATTLCHCWRLKRHDGVVFGFTDHDRDIVLDDVTFHAGTGLDASQTQTSSGLAVGGADVQGAFDAASLTESDLSNGLYDDASVEIWIVDWSNLTSRVLMDVATIGEVRRSEFSFVAELRSLAHRFDEEIGRYFQRACSADLGDARCRVDLAGSAFATTGTVVRSQGQSAVLVMLDADFPLGFFAGGSLRVTSGANSGARVPIRTHAKTPAGHVFTGQSGRLGALVVGDRLAVTAGCDKSPETCREKFANIANFRGFPHMPGNDVMLSYPNSHMPVMDGGSLFR